MGIVTFTVPGLRSAIILVYIQAGLSSVSNGHVYIPFILSFILSGACLPNIKLTFVCENVEDIFELKILLSGQVFGQ